MRRLMEYKIISGRVVETKRSFFSVKEYSKPRGTRQAGNTSEQKIRANEKSSTRNLARVINCNFEAGDVFCTLSYDGMHYPPDLDYEGAKQHLKKFRAKLRRAYSKETGEALKAIWVTANWSPHKNAPARIHHHMILPGDAAELARKVWQEFGGAGSFKMEGIDGRGDHTDLASYMMENVHGRTAGENKWSCCRGMDRPIYTEPVEVTDMEDMQPDYGSTIKDVEEVRDEEGTLIGKYMRCLLKERPHVRGGQVVLPKKQTRRRT